MDPFEPEFNESAFAGGGEMAALMRARDWAGTPLGPVSAWPQSLRTIVRVMLTSRFAMWMGWGPDLAFFYNDAYRDMTLAAKHPWALGRPSREVWAEIWPQIGPRIDKVLQTGEATWDEDLLLFLERSGYTEETYHTFSYSPVADDGGLVRGNLCVVTEVSDRVIAERRMALLRDVAAGIAGTNNEAELFAAAERAINADSRDLPFTLTYLFDEDTTTARLVSRTGIAGSHPAAAASVECRAAETTWPLAEVFDRGVSIVVGDLASKCPGLSGGPWQKAAEQALVVPIARQGLRHPAGVFIAGLNPFRPLDEAYRSFMNLLVGQVAAALANVHAYEQERRRTLALAELDRAKTVFFSNVSHEFRTPLALILGPLADARGVADLLPPGIAEQLDVAHRNSVRLLKLVNTLLEFSRIEAGRMQARYEPVDLCVLTADLASTFESAMASAGLDFHVECGPVEEPVYVDREMWEKIVLNLISNAFKFTFEGGVTVSVAAPGRGRVELSVRDTGLGIPPEQLPRVFDRFHRVEGSRGRSHEGSGIGLALVSELVKLHRGELTVESTVGEGTTFTVTVPTGRTHLPADQVSTGSNDAVRSNAGAYANEALQWLPPRAGHEQGPAPAQESHDPLSARRGHVLVADDNADMRDYTRRLLSDRWSVDVARNGAEALSAARAQRPDVIVTDVMMPELDGFGLLRELRADSTLATVPVIMLSARAGEEARIEGLAASADDYLVKPFTARELLARVDAQFLKARIREVEQHHAARLRSLFSQAPVAIAVVRGAEHTFELANPRYLELIGQRPIVGKPVREALPELAGQGIYELLDGVRASGEPVVGRAMRLTLNRGAGGAPEDCYFDFVYQPIFSEAAEIEAIAIVVYEVTELAMAKRQAETANRLKDEFLATLSHELRTPLNAVLGYTQMLRAGVIGAHRQGTVLETIERNARLQEQLIEDVLDVSRIITGKLRLDVRAVDLAAVLHEALNTVALAATAKGVRLQSAIDQTDVHVAGDAQRLQQVVWNLLSNAVKFTPRGGRVQLRLQRINSHVEIVVSDTGEGVDPEFMPYLFERFRQADSGFARAHGGLGLGLAICRHLVEAHGGRIDALSPGKGKGTTVRVELPLMIVHGEKDDDVVRAHPRRDSAPSMDLKLVDLTGIRVLLVDDDRDALAMARDALAAAGAQVETGATAVEALRRLDAARFDAIVLDIGMPQVDGYELLQRIRQRTDDENSRVPVAALTAYARPTDRTRSLMAGFQLHLSKPIPPTELAAAVLSLARGGRVRADS